MTSLWLPWGWMTHEEINNSQKTRRAEGEEGEQEREAVADFYTQMTHTYTQIEMPQIFATKAFLSKDCPKVTTT